MYILHVHLKGVFICCRLYCKYLTTFLDGYCSTVQGLLDWFEVDLGFTEFLFIQIDLCVMSVFVLHSPSQMSMQILYNCIRII